MHSNLALAGSLIMLFAVLYILLVENSNIPAHYLVPGCDTTTGDFYQPDDCTGRGEKY